MAPKEKNGSGLARQTIFGLDIIKLEPVQQEMGVWQNSVRPFLVSEIKIKELKQRKVKQSKILLYFVSGFWKEI